MSSTETKTETQRPEAKSPRPEMATRTELLSKNAELEKEIRRLVETQQVLIARSETADRNLQTERKARKEATTETSKALARLAPSESRIRELEAKLRISHDSTKENQRLGQQIRSLQVENRRLRDKVENLSAHDFRAAAEGARSERRDLENQFATAQRRWSEERRELQAELYEADQKKKHLRSRLETANEALAKANLPTVPEGQFDEASQPQPEPEAA